MQNSLMTALRTPAGRLYGGGVVAVLVGLFLPWARVPDVISISGIETSDGKLFLVLLVVAFALLAAFAAGIATGGVSIGMIVVGALMSLLGVVEVIDVTSSPEADAVGLKSGIGLWLDFIGSLAVLAGAIMFRRARPREAAADPATGPMGGDATPPGGPAEPRP